MANTSHESDRLMTFQLRPALPADVDKIIQLLQQLSSFVPSKTEQDKIQSLISTCDNSHFFVAVNSHKIIGFGALLVGQLFRGGKIGYIEEIVTDKSARGQGVGKAIVEQLAQISKDIGCYKCVLACAAHNVTFYEKCGFEDAGHFLSKSNLNSKE